MLVETISLEGHIIDSNLLPQVLDDIMSLGGEFRILELHVGRSREERSHARIEVRAENDAHWEELLALLQRHGAIWHATEDADVEPADRDGAFPERFYATTNHRTQVRLDGKWRDVLDQEMDCGIRFDADAAVFRCVPMTLVRRDDLIVCGHAGVKVLPIERQAAKGAFEFMASDVSSEKPKHVIIRNCARQMIEARRAGARIVLVGGPAIVHTGAVPHVVKLIEGGFVQAVFAGNALAAHDIEYALYGTSLGVYVDRATLADTGHEHHIRAINTIRRLGGIQAAVDRGVLTSGIMHACVRRGVQFVLGGSVRDDGPLPEVFTDVLEAQAVMRAEARDAGFVLMVATALHSIATGNLLPARIPVVCVDINPMTLTKLGDRGSFQTVSLVSDVEPFFRALVDEIEELEASNDATRA